MESWIFVATCLLVTIPFSTGLECYACTGGETAGVVTGNDCYEAVTANMAKQTCPTPASGNEARCVQTKTEAEALGVSATTIVRACASVASSTANECTETSAGAGVTAEVTKCYCAGELCNGQTTLVPAIFTCMVGLILALFATL